MAHFTGTDEDEVITQSAVSASVSTEPGFPFPSKGRDSITAGGGNDTVEGGRGDDLLRLGDGDDLAIWAPRHGSDSILAGAGFDTVRVQGDGRAEAFALADGFYDSVLFRDLGFVRLDMRAVERVEIDAAGGGDYVQISDLSDTRVKEVLVAFGAGGRLDEIAFIGTGEAETVTLGNTASGGILMQGLGVRTEITGFEAARDSFILSLGEGDDVVEAAGFAGADLNIATGSGDDRGQLGSGDDRWGVVGDFGQDTVDGGAGRDTLDLDASLADDVIILAGDAAAATATRGADSVAMTSIERIEVEGASGNDSVDGAGVTGGMRLFLWGHAGDDTLVGGARGDRLEGGWGSDSLAGGGGADRFVVADANANGVQEQDLVTDFDASAGDLLDLGGSAWSAEVTAQGVLVTLAAGDMDQVLLIGLTSLGQLAVVA